MSSAKVSVLSSAPRPVRSWGAWFARWHFDLILGLLLLAVSGLGLFVLYSASGQSLGMVISQAQRLVLGLVIMVVLAQAPPEFYRAAAPWFYGFSMLLLLAVALLGQ